MPEHMSENIPAEWVGKRVAVQYKAYSFVEGQGWTVGLVHGTVEEKNDLGLFIRQQRGQADPRDVPPSVMLITYDALLTVDVAGG